MSPNSWDDSSEKEDWIESGGGDEDYDRYYQKWHRRVNKDK